MFHHLSILSLGSRSLCLLFLGGSVLLLISGFAGASSEKASASPTLTTSTTSTTSKTKSHVSISFGTYFSQGNYGSEDPISFEALPDTKVSAFPMSLKYRTGEWSFSLHSAFVDLSGNSTRLFFDADLNEIQSETLSQSRSGFGDLSVKMSYRLPRVWEHSFVRIGSKVKLPTSKKSDNLGSGETDYSAFMTCSTRIGRAILGGHLGYQWMGDTATRNYNNRWSARVSGQYLLSKHFLIGSSYYFKQASHSDNQAIRKLNTSLSWIPAKNRSYTLFTGAGFSDASPDWSAGIQFTYKY